ncbi:MAG TPA: carboxymuconolactone decarboxylase family protein [Candidatus Saccharimonadales bacterium]|nr:carboxymuconolactone decarboxylase family protein [Candidatus Saccharimonadales bacterium]
MDDAPEASLPALAALARRTGRVLNIYGEMAHAPAVVGAYLALQHALAEHGTLDARTREAVALAVSAVDSCDYCQSAHTISAQRAGLSAEQTVQLRGGEVSFDPGLAALVASFVRSPPTSGLSTTQRGRLPSMPAGATSSSPKPSRTSSSICSPTISTIWWARSWTFPPPRLSQS